MIRLATILAVLLIGCSSTEPEPSAKPGDPAKQRIRDFWTAFRRANQNRIARDFYAAAEGYRTALELDPKHEESLYYLGVVHEETGDYSDAAGSYERLIEINPSSGRGLTQLAALLASVAPGAPTDLARARELLERAIQLNPEQAGPFLQLGKLSLTLGETDQALERFQIAARAGSPEGHSWAGVALFLDNKRKQASAEFENVLEIRRRELKLSGAGIAAEGDIRPEPGKPLSALDKAALMATQYLRWMREDSFAAPMSAPPGVKPAGRASYSEPYLFVAGPRAALYHKSGDRFTDVTQTAGLAGITDVVDSVWAEDELYLLGKRNRLLRKQGGDAFRDVTEEAGLGGSRITSRAVFFDSGGYLLEIGSPPRLFRNQGGRFVHAAFPEVDGAITDAVVEDFNSDGRPDIFLLRWRKPAVVLFHPFTEQTSLHSINGDRYSAISLDYDRDGQPDLFVSGYGSAPMLFRNQNGRFEDVSTQAGLSTAYRTVQVVAEGLHPDILLVNGSFDGLGVEPSIVLRMVDGKRFEEHLRLPPANRTSATVVGHDPAGIPVVYFSR